MSNQNIDDRAQVAGLRSNIYGLLSRVFIYEADTKLLQLIRQEDIINSFKEIGVELGKEFLEQPIEEQLDDLAVEYARLFIGPGKNLSPHESIYVGTFGGQQDSKEGLLWGEVTVKVQEFIEEVGYQLEANYHGIPDHLGVELELMQQLAKQEQDAWLGGDAETAVGALGHQKYFLQEHILKWIPRFCQMIVNETESSFYRQMAEVTREFIAFDHVQLTESADGAKEQLNH